MVCHQRPFRCSAGCGVGQNVGDAVMQPPADAGRGQLGGHLAEKFVLERPLALADRSKHPGSAEIVEQGIDLAPADPGHRRQQVAVEAAADQRGGFDDQQ
jgi:hypothetical protein